MANVFDSTTIVLDTFTGDIDCGSSCFGLTNTPFFISSIIFSNPTAADIVVVKNARSEVVAELSASTTTEQVSVYGPIKCEGLKLLSADQTVTTGKVLIHLC